MVRAWETGAPSIGPVEKQPTIASALAAADPGLLGARAMEAVRASGGAAAAVPDEEIRAAMRDLAGEGLFIEPSGAVTLAGLRRLVAAGQVDPGESVVCVLTGSGFKDFERIVEMVDIPDEVVTGYDSMLAAAREVA
jgi:threonine synthase